MPTGLKKVIIKIILDLEKHGLLVITDRGREAGIKR